MSDTLLTVIGTVVGIAAIGVMIAGVVILKKGITKLQGSSVEALAASARSKGWQFDHKAEMGSFFRRWAGTTDGVGWTATHEVTRTSSTADGYRQHKFLWQAGVANALGTPVLVLPERSALSTVDEKMARLPGFLKTIGSAAIDRVAPTWFGADAADVDLSTWRPVEGHGIANMRVLVPVADAAALVAVRQLAATLNQHAAALAAFSEPPAILIRPQAVHLAGRTDMSADDVARVVAAGAGIARALPPTA